jgi:hypothetical protein
VPQASDAQRAAWGTDGGAGDEKAISFLQEKGFKLTKKWAWIKPSPTYVLTEDDWLAIEFLIDEWDFDGLAIEQG